MKAGATLLTLAALGSFLALRATAAPAAGELALGAAFRDARAAADSSSRARDAAAPGPDFKGVIAQIMALYVPKLAADGISLSFVEKHEGLIVGWGDRPDLTHAILGFDSGYYADEKITADGFRFAACHEMGHIMGSAPHRPSPPEYDGPMDRNGDLLISAEGEADYYAAAKCMRLLLEGEDNGAYIRAHGAAPLVAARCGEQYPDLNASALCQRIAMAGLNFLDSMAIPLPTAFDTPAREVAQRTLTGEYPTRQCRLDTMFAGALCPTDKNTPTDGYDPAAGLCTSRNFPLGARPACWFKE
jgi:hypothetical protein